MTPGDYLLCFLDRELSAGWREAGVGVSGHAFPASSVSDLVASERVSRDIDPLPEGRERERERERESERERER